MKKYNCIYQCGSQNPNKILLNSFDNKYTKYTVKMTMTTRNEVRDLLTKVITIEIAQSNDRKI